MGVTSSAHGALAERPLPRLLIYLRNKAVTGRLEIIDEAGDTSTLFLRAGAPAHVDRPDHLDRLDRVLIGSSALSEKKLLEIEPLRAASGKRLGELLTELGILERDKVVDALKLQLRRKLTRLFFPQKGTFDVFFHEHEHGAGHSADVTVDAASVIYPGIRAAYTESRMSRELVGLAGRMVRLVNVTPAALRPIGFQEADEETLATLRRTAMRIDSMAALDARAAGAKPVLLALLYLNLLEITDAPTASGIFRAVTPRPAAGTGEASQRAAEPALPARTTQTRPAVTATASPPPPETGRRTTATRPAVSETKPAAAAPSPSPPPPPPAAAAPAARERSSATMAAVVPVTSDPRVHFKRGEVFLTGGDLARAAEAFAAAAKLAPEEPLYRAYLAWTKFWNPDESRDTAAAAAMKEFTDLVKTRPAFARGYYFMGQIYKYQKELPKAEKAFRLALEKDPKLLDAEREVRLIQMRKTK